MFPSGTYLDCTVIKIELLIWSKKLFWLKLYFLCLFIKNQIKNHFPVMAPLSSNSYAFVYNNFCDFVSLLAMEKIDASSANTLQIDSIPSARSFI